MPSARLSLTFDLVLSMVVFTSFCGCVVRLRGNVPEQRARRPAIFRRGAAWPLWSS